MPASFLKDVREFCYEMICCFCCTARDQILIQTFSAGSLGSLPTHRSTEGDEQDLPTRLGRVDDRRSSINREMLFRRHTLSGDASIDGEVDSAFLFEGILGEGSFSSVQKAHLKRAPNITRAIKKVRKRNAKLNLAVQREVAILRRLDHPNICRIFETFESDDFICLVMECVDGRELFAEISDAITQNTHDEGRCAYILRQVFSGLQYCHDREVIHRDLKPENIMVCDAWSTSEPAIKIIDFGLAVLTQPRHSYKSKDLEGTIAYLAPEVHANNKFSAASDVWSIGIILFIMIVGAFPLPETSWSIQDQLMMVENVKVRSLLSGLLQKRSDKRFTAGQAYQHPWTSGQDKAARIDERRMINSFQEFYKMNTLQKAGLRVMASQMSSSQMEDFRHQFQLVDTDGNGTISKEELLKFYLTHPPPQVKDVAAWVDNIFEELDSDGSGELEFTEWAAAAMQSLDDLKECAMAAAFRALDVDDDGKITIAELSALVKVSVQELESTLARNDGNGDGELDFEDFKTLLVACSPATPQDK